MYRNLFLVNISSVSYCFECKKRGRRDIKQMVGSNYLCKFVNVEIFVESPIIADRREYLGTRPLKSIPTRSHQKEYFENTNLNIYAGFG